MISFWDILKLTENDQIRQDTQKLIDDWRTFPVGYMGADIAETLTALRKQYGCAAALAMDAGIHKMMTEFVKVMDKRS